MPLIAAITFLLSAYIFSITAYKIWYIAMLPCGAIWLFATPWNRSLFSIFCKETAFILLYWVAIGTSVAFSGYPILSHRWVAIDFIFLPVFVLFLTTALINPSIRIESGLRCLVWVAIVSAAYYWGADRIATRAWWILPLISPFSVAAIYRRNRFAYAELAANILLMFMTGTRVPFVITVATTIAAFLVMMPNPGDLLRRSAIALGTTCLAALIALIVPATAEKMDMAFTRLTGMQTVAFTISHSVPVDIVPSQPPRASKVEQPRTAPEEIPASPHASDNLSEADADITRVRISAVVKDIFSERGITAFGIGYGNIERVYAAKYHTPDTYTAHNIFVAWLIELGIFGVLVVAIFLGRFFIVCARHWNDWHFRCLAVSMIGFLAYGLLHPVHHGPMLFVLLGLCFGGDYRRLDSADLV